MLWNTYYKITITIIVCFAHADNLIRPKIPNRKPTTSLSHHNHHHHLIISTAHTQHHDCYSAKLKSTQNHPLTHILSRLNFIFIKKRSSFVSDWLTADYDKTPRPRLKLGCSPEHDLSASKKTKMTTQTTTLVKRYQGGRTATSPKSSVISIELSHISKTVKKTRNWNGNSPEQVSWDNFSELLAVLSVCWTTTTW